MLSAPPQDSQVSPDATRGAGAVSSPVLRLADALPKPQQPCVLQIAEVLAQPPSEPELPEDSDAPPPTVGSIEHRLGTCKPCAFVHTKGCTNGSQCAFCHLCRPNEMRRRKKAKLALQHKVQGLSDML